MKLEIWWSDKLRVEYDKFIEFIQLMANRYQVGDARDGMPAYSKSYLTRLKKELRAYEKGGNVEHLINAANYCILENIAPENELHHFNPLVGSVTRGKAN